MDKKNYVGEAWIGDVVASFDIRIFVVTGLLHRTNAEKLLHLGKKISNIQ